MPIDETQEPAKTEVKPTTQPRSAKAVFGVLALAAALISFYYYTNHRKYSRAEAALNSVLDACGTRNSYVVAQRVVDAKQAFAELPSEDQSMYDSKLESRMKFIGCLIR